MSPLPSVPGLYLSSLFSPKHRTRSFYYITGVDEPDMDVTYDVAKDRLILWIPPPRSPNDALFIGDVPSIKDCLFRYDIDDARYSSGLPSFLHTCTSTIFTLHSSGLPPMLSTSLPVMYYYHYHHLPAHPLRLSSTPSSPPNVPFVPPDSVPAYNTTALQPAMDAARLIKTPYEIAMIRRACAVSSRAHRAVAAGLRHMYSEANIEATFRATCTNLGAHTQAYSIIAGAGENAARLHYNTNQAPLLHKQLVVLDAGCEWHNYASDITRTLPLPSGHWLSPEARGVHDLVAAMQASAIAMLRPGAHWIDLVEKTYDVGLPGLHRLGLLRGSLSEIMTTARGVITAFFPHGLGHPVGLEVHDLPASWLKSARAGARVSLKTCVPPEVLPTDSAVLAHCNKTSRKNSGPSDGSSDSYDSDDDDDDDDDLFDYYAWMRLREGMVVTIEPGIYFNREYIDAFMLARRELAAYIDIDALERFWSVGGCRIEDVVLITADGHEVLSTAPKGRELWGIIRGGE